MDRRTLSVLHGIRSGLGLALCLFLPTIMIAQLDRSRPPAPAPPPIVKLADHGSFTMANGMRVIVVENKKLPLVGVQVRFDVPPVLQEDKVGYVDMMGELLATGTGLRTKVVLDEEVDQLGAHLMTTNDGVFISGLKRHLPAMMDIVQDVVTNSTFPPKELDRVRTRYRSSVVQRRDDPDAIAEAVGRVVTFGRSHPYGEVMTGKSLNNITRDHINGYYRRFFRPEIGYLVFVGDLSLKEAKDLAKKHFSNWKVPMEATVNEDGSENVPGLGIMRYMPGVMGPSGERRVAYVDRPGAAQSVIRVSFPLNLHPRDLRTMNAQVMNTILGGGVFNARLMQNLREDKAYTYGAYSNLEVDRFNGSFTVSVSVRTEVTDSAVTEIIREMDRMRNTPVLAEEVELAKNYMAGSFGRSLEDPRTVARFALNTFLNGLPKDHYATYLKRLEAVKPADVEKAAQEFLHPDMARILIVGDKVKIEHKLPALTDGGRGEVRELDENGEIRKDELVALTNKTAEQVTDAYIEAIGGRAAAEKIRSMHVRMTTNVGGMALTIDQWHGPDGKFRSETRAGEMGVVQEVIFDGRRGVSRSPQGEEELFSADLWDVIAGAPPVPELHMKRFVERAVVGGITSVDGTEAYRVTLSTRGGTTINDYFSVKNGLRLKRVDQKMMMGRPVSITTLYSDHKKEGGILLPHKVVQTGGPMGEVVLNVEKVEMDPVLRPGFFETGLPPVEEGE